MGTYTRIPFPSAFSKYQTILDATYDLVAAGVFDPAFAAYGLAVFGVTNPTFAVGQSGAIATLVDPFANLGLGTTILSTFGTVPSQFALNNGVILPGESTGVAGTSYSIGILATAGNGSRILGETLTFMCTSASGSGGGSGSGSGGPLDFSDPNNSAFIL